MIESVEQKLGLLNVRIDGRVKELRKGRRRAYEDTCDRKKSKGSI